ncbi:MAG TPA: dehydrogenase [Casimicrobiaceae bacterium]|nr:dehydrogenase [Casimicrobiaceae bacterium]
MKVRSRAPLRLGLAGGGTDLSPYSDRFGGLVLNATVDLYAYATLTRLDEPRLSFAALDRDHTEDHALQPAVRAHGPLILHQGVYNRIVQEFCNGEPLALMVATHADAPAGSGLGSSSTLVVAMVTAYAELLHLPLGEYDIAKLAYEIERVDLGLLGGRQDHYAAAFGGVNFMEFGSGERVVVNPLRIKPSILAEIEASVVLFYTGTARESARIIAEQVERMKAGDSASLAALHDLKEEARLTKDCILRGDLRQFGRCMQKGWEAKQRTASSISTGALERALAVARDAGAYAGKVSGAGGGGFVILFADPPQRVRVEGALRSLGEGELYHCHFTEHGAQAWRVD